MPKTGRRSPSPTVQKGRESDSSNRKRSSALLTLEIIQLAGNWRVRKKLAARLELVLPAIMALGGAKLPPGDYVMTLVLTDDRHQKMLNKKFRSIDKPTNVLSFPQYAPAQYRRLKPQAQPIFLGDITLSYQYIVCETKNGHKILIDHIIHLAIHGILHILGYDHRTSRHAAAMKKLERTILQAMQIPDPYAPSADAGQRRKRRKRYP